MAKLRITPNGTVLESEIFLTDETLMRLTNPENAKRIKAALSDFGEVSHRIEEFKLHKEPAKNVSIMSCPIKDSENIELVLEKLFKTHTGFISWAQSLPAPTSTIDFKDDDEEICDEETVELVKNVKEVLKDNPLACKMTIFVKDGIDELCLSENGIKMLLNTFIEKYGKKEESL